MQLDLDVLKEFCFLIPCISKTEPPVNNKLRFKSSGLQTIYANLRLVLKYIIVRIRTVDTLDGIWCAELYYQNETTVPRDYFLLSIWLLTKGAT